MTIKEVEENTYRDYSEDDVERLRFTKKQYAPDELYAYPPKLKDVCESI